MDTLSNTDRELVRLLGDKAEALRARFTVQYDEGVVSKVKLQWNCPVHGSGYKDLRAKKLGQAACLNKLAEHLKDAHGKCEAPPPHSQCAVPEPSGDWFGQLKKRFFVWGRGGGGGHTQASRPAWGGGGARIPWPVWSPPEKVTQAGDMKRSPRS